MPLSNDLTQHPTPAQAFELATQYATLLRTLFLHPEFKYAQPPTAEFVKPDPTNHIGLFWVSDFVQNTYVEFVVPFLPAGATRKCKAIGNPWAYEDPAYAWEWTWDPATETLKDGEGNVKEFPRLSAAVAREKVTDVITRGMMVKKLVLENAQDVKAQILIGGAPYDFGEDVHKATKAIP